MPRGELRLFFVGDLAGGLDADEVDATAHEYHESLNQSDSDKANDSQDQENQSGDSAKSDNDANSDSNTNSDSIRDAAPKGRKRRRASSSGIITA